MLMSRMSSYKAAITFGEGTGVTGKHAWHGSNPLYLSIDAYILVKRVLDFTSTQKDNSNHKIAQ